MENVKEMISLNKFKLIKIYLYFEAIHIIFTYS